ncbi:hypothetical protein X745_30635 [Mesorhizobium sp. LNJC374B00]|nr:hypothetical protein X745_30635 [Mesorhizobium sp. LNJC374B00]
MTSKTLHREVRLSAVDCPDIQQGFLKKINLLLPNIAFKFANAATRFCQPIGTTLFSRQCKTCRQGLPIWWCLGRPLLWTPVSARR